MTAFVLVHSPLVGPECWEPVAAELRARGRNAVAPSLETAMAGGGPYWPACVDAIREAGARLDEPLVLAAHSGAGPLLPALGAALEGRACALIFVDASLPQPPGSSWLDSIPAAFRTSPAFDEAARIGYLPNQWQDERLWERVGISDADQRHALAAAARSLPIAAYAEPYPHQPDWELLPAGYVAFAPNPFYAPVAEEARRRGWPVRELAGSHFHMLVDPPAVAIELLGLVGALAGRD
ncbi:MAG: alpha/beta hydrolase [Chloroflexi bacterium]|nr:alpha/beta hydrolase [Chloroflexota bacterium]